MVSGAIGVSNTTAAGDPRSDANMRVEVFTRSASVDADARAVDEGIAIVNARKTSGTASMGRSPVLASARAIVKTRALLSRARPTVMRLPAAHSCAVGDVKNAGGMKPQTGEKISDSDVDTVSITVHGGGREVAYGGWLAKMCVCRCRRYGDC